MRSGCDQDAIGCAQDAARMRSGCDKDAVMMPSRMQSGSNQEAVRMRSGCGQDAIRMRSGFVVCSLLFSYIWEFTCGFAFLGEIGLRICSVQVNDSR